MKWLYETFDIGGGEKVDELIDGEHGHIMRISGLYPYLRNGRWALSLIHIFIYISILTYSIYILLNTAILVYSYDINMAAQSVHIAIIFLTTMTIIFSLNFNRNKINNIYLILRDNYYKYDDGLEFEELDSWKTEINSRKRMILSIIPAYVAVTILVTVVMPLIDDYFGYHIKEIEGIDMRLPVPLWHPFSRDSTASFCAIVFLTSLNTFISGAVVCAIDMFYIFISFTTLLQYKILHKSIEQLQARAENIHKIRFPNEPISEDKMKSCYMYCIKQNVQHHLIIETVINECCAAGYVPLGIEILVVSFIISASLFGFVLGEGTPSTYAFSSVLLVSEIGNVGLLCYFGQQITDHSNDIVSALYNTNWPTAPKEVSSSMLIMVEKLKRPVEIKAFGLWALNYDLFTAIINTSYSYFNVLLGARTKIRFTKAAKSNKKKF